MRMFVALFAVAVVGVACDSTSKEGAEAAKLETFTARDVKPQSREQIRYYAGTEGRIRPAEDAVKGFNERVRAGYEPSPEKQAALATMQAAIQNARTKINALKTAGVSEWEAMKPDLEAAMTEVDNRRTAFDALP